MHHEWGFRRVNWNNPSLSRDKLYIRYPRALGRYKNVTRGRRCVGGESHRRLTS